jgi:hypothetical protein
MRSFWHCNGRAEVVRTKNPADVAALLDMKFDDKLT